MEIRFGNRPVTLKRGIEHVKRAIIPTAARRAALAGIAWVSDDSPDRAVERFGWDGLDRIEERAVAAPGTSRHHLDEHVVIEAIDDLEDFDGPVVVNEVNGPFAVQLRMARVEPRPHFFG